MPDKESKVTNEAIEKLISDSSKKIELHNLLHRESEKLRSLIVKWDTQVINSEQVVSRSKEIVSESEASTVLLQKIYLYGGYFGDESHTSFWERCLSNLADLPAGNGSTFLLEMRAYPSLLVMYAGAIGSVAANNYTNLKSIMDSQMTMNSGRTMLAAGVNCYLFNSNANHILETDSRTTLPLCRHLSDNIKKIMPKTLIFENKFDEIFDRAEAFISMIVSDYNVQYNESTWAPIGKFSYTHDRFGKNQTTSIKQEIEKAGNDWPPLKAGLFGGNLERALAAIQNVENLSKSF